MDYSLCINLVPTKHGKIVVLISRFLEDLLLQKDIVSDAANCAKTIILIWLETTNCGYVFF